MADRCYECGRFDHAAECSAPLVVARLPGDTEAEARLAVILERCNARAAQALLDRGIHPHTYRAGDGSGRRAA